MIMSGVFSKSAVLRCGRKNYHVIAIGYFSDGTWPISRWVWEFRRHWMRVATLRVTLPNARLPLGLCACLVNQPSECCKRITALSYSDLL